MQEHVERIMDRYGEGCERCLVTREGKTEEVIPMCSMWDPIAAGSFDEEGIRRYTAFLRELYGGEIAKLNRAYGIQADSFEQLRPETYWFALRYAGLEGEKSPFEEEDVRKRTERFQIFRDNALWKARELVLYFEAMSKALKEKNPQLFLCPDMTQWGYFLNIYGRQQVDGDNEYSDLWDTSLRGIDLYALAPHVDSCHFITVPVTPDGYPDAYVVSCQHSMMRVMNEGRPMVGGIYWGRYIYHDIYDGLRYGWLYLLWYERSGRRWGLKQDGDGFPGIAGGGQPLVRGCDRPEKRDTPERDRPAVSVGDGACRALRGGKQ